MIVNRKSPAGLLRPIIDLVHRMTAMLMFTAEYPSSLRDASNVISGMMGGNIVQFVSPACVGIGETFFSRFGLTVGVLVGVIAGIWAKAIFQICKHKRKMAKSGREGEQVDATIAPETKVPDDDNGAGVGDSSSTTSTSIVLSNKRGPQVLMRTKAVLSAGQDTIIIILLMYPGVSGHAMQFFRCHDIDGVEYMMADYRLKCYDTAWYGMLVLVALVLLFLALGSPLLMGWVLYQKRDQIKAEAKADAEAEAAKAALALLPAEDGVERIRCPQPPMDPMSVLYKLYRPEVYYYEPIKMLFKISLWCALVLFDEGSEMQLGLALIINTVQLAVHIYLLPLRGTASTPAWQINMLESGSLVVICFSTFIEESGTWCTIVCEGVLYEEVHGYMCNVARFCEDERALHVVGTNLPNCLGTTIFP